MARQADLVEAAIKLDERALVDSGDPGANHFIGVLRLDPRHLSDNTDPPGRIANEIEVDFSSLLFMVAESIRQVLVGRDDEARTILANLRYSETVEHILVMLVQAWLPGGTTSLARIDEYLRDAVVDPDLKSRVYMKLMTWELEARGKGPHAAAYYDLAIANASAVGLQQALYGVGEAFGRETRLFFPPARDPQNTYSWILDSVSSASADELIQMARKQISPFTRTFGGDPRAVPMPIRAAELQGGWAGAYWILERIWRVKASIILVSSRDPAERADGMTYWVLSGGSRVRELVTENENGLSRELVAKILVDDLKNGTRVAADDWVELCLALWDELPSEISTRLISTLEIPAWAYEYSALARENRSVILFCSLSAVEREKWVERYESLQPAQRLTVCLALSAAQARDLPDRLHDEIRSILLDYCNDERQSVDPDVIETLAALVSELADDAPERSRFKDLLPAEYSAEIGVRYPQLVTADRIREDMEMTVQKIRQQLAQNQRGQWTTFGTSLAFEVARCLVALKSSDERSIDTIVDFATASASAANDVIDAVSALSWLADEGLLTPIGTVESRLPYRVDVSPVDRMWTGRDDIRAINAVIAGLHARLSTSRREAIALLVAASRDPDAQVRRLAVEQFCDGNLVVSGLETSVDAAILGAIYDPDFRVQTAAIRGIASISDLLVCEIAWARLVSVWDAAHRRVRMAAAGMAARQRYTEKSIERLRADLLRLASADRSLLVRRAAGQELNTIG